MAVCIKTLIAAALLAVLLPVVATAGDADRGEKLYGLCTQCHGATGAGNSLFLAPSIAGLAEWYVTAQLGNFQSGVRGTHPDDVGGLRMYPMSLSIASDDDIAALAAYVSSMPAPDLETTVHGDAGKGKNYYVTCTACHGAAGEGNQALKAPRLVGTSDWYLVESLKKFKAGIRGGNPGNANAVMMRGMALSLVDDQAIDDVVAHILTLSK